MIGQFGIGLLSAFVVAYRVEIETLSCQPQSKPWRWVSEGQHDYELGPGTRTISERPPRCTLPTTTATC